MCDKFRAILILTFTGLSAIGFCLYVGFFSFYLIRINTSPLIISALIGSTALSSVFWGPVAGRLIDRSRHKFVWLSIGQVICGACVYLFGNVHSFSISSTTLLVLCFSLSLNLTSIISNQYLLPLLRDDYERCVALSSRISGIAVFICGVGMAAFYDSVKPVVFFSFSAGSYILSALLPLLFLSENRSSLNETAEETCDKKTKNIYQQTLLLLRKHWFLALAMCVLAYSETSFNTNFDVIAFSLGATPASVIFLFGALSGVLGAFSSWAYPRLFEHVSIHFRWIFFLIAFTTVFMVSAILAMWGYDKHNPWFIPCLAFILEIVGIWWSIFIAGRVRACSEKNAYGQTMAAFRVPRSLITFIGVTTIGSALQSGELWWILIFNTFLLGALILIYIRAVYYEEKNRSESPKQRIDGQ